MFTGDPFNIAPGAPRYARGSWLVLALGLLFAAACAWPLAIGIRNVADAERIVAKRLERSKARADRDAALQLARNEPAALAKAQAHLKLQQLLRVSWSGLFGALESAGITTNGAASVLSLAPVNTDAEAAEVNITALARSPAAMLDYIRALKADPHVRTVELSVQQPSPTDGPEVTRFQLALVWARLDNALQARQSR